MALTTSAAVDHEHRHSSSPRASSVGGQVSSAGSSPSAPSTTSSTCSLGDRIGFDFDATSPQRGRSKRKEVTSRAAAPKGHAIAAEEPKGRRRQRQSRQAANASVSGSSSPTSTISSSSTGDRLGFRTSHQSPCFGSKLPRGRGSKPNSTGARSPRKHEEPKGGGVGTYLREISRLLKRGNAEKSPPGTTRIARPVQDRCRGNVIASEEEMRAFVIASARNIERNGPPVLPLGFL